MIDAFSKSYLSYLQINADFRRLLEGCAMFENFFILCENLR